MYILIGFIEEYIMLNYVEKLNPKEVKIQDPGGNKHLIL
jgi:hypothetical protein